MSAHSSRRSRDGRRRRAFTGHGVALALALTATTTAVLAAPAQASDGSRTSTGDAPRSGQEDRNYFERAWNCVKGWADGDEDERSDRSARLESSHADSDRNTGSAANSGTSTTPATPAATSPASTPTATAPATAPSTSTATSSAETPTSAAAAQAVTTLSGEAMPTGDLAGWTQVFADDFTTPVALGDFPGAAYSSSWSGYEQGRDTSRAGSYSPSDVLSVSDGALDMHLRTENGQPLSAAPAPVLDGTWGGWTYGRYSVRFRADAVPGYKTAWLLWPDSGVWDEGEIDFPEGDLTGTINAFNHELGNPENNALAVDTGATYTDWHTTTIEWTPSGVTFILDGEVVGHSEVSPSTPMHFVLQTETSGGTPPADASGHVQVDWVTMYRQA